MDKYKLVVRPCQITRYDKNEEEKEGEDEPIRDKKKRLTKKVDCFPERTGEFVDLQGIKAEKWLRQWTKVDLRRKSNKNNWLRKVNQTELLDLSADIYYPLSLTICHLAFQISVAIYQNQYNKKLKESKDETIV
jgi:hypothetical protein